MKHKACIITNKKIKTVFLAVLCLVAATLFLTASSESINGALKGLHLCANILIPTLFPFCVISTFIMRSQISNLLGKILAPVGKVMFGINGNATCVVLLSMLSGYPVGAKLTHLLYEQNQISKKQAQNLICCCVNPGPAFIVLAVGKGILNSQKIGYVLLAANVISCIIINIIFRSNDTVTQRTNTSTLSYTDAFVQSVSDACASVISVCSFVVLFSAFEAVITTFLGQKLQIMFTALSEVTTATIYFRNNIFIVALILGWCGFCVHAQVMSLCKKLMPNYLKFVLIRILHGLLLAGISELFVKIFNISVSVANITKSPVYSGTAASLPCSIALIITCIIFLFSCPKNTLGKFAKV